MTLKEITNKEFWDFINHGSEPLGGIATHLDIENSLVSKLTLNVGGRIFRFSGRLENLQGPSLPLGLPRDFAYLGANLVFMIYRLLDNAQKYEQNGLYPIDAVYNPLQDKIHSYDLELDDPGLTW